MAADEKRPLSSYAFSNYGGDAELYNGIHDLEAEVARLGEDAARLDKMLEWHPHIKTRQHLDANIANSNVTHAKFLRMMRDDAAQESQR